MPDKEIGRPLKALLLFAFFLPTQLGISLLAEHEPYPTIRMPGFGDAPTEDGLFRTQLTRISIEYADGTELTPHVADLMSAFRYSSSIPSFNYVLRDDARWENARAEVEPWLAKAAQNLNANSQPRAISICWYYADVDIWTSEYVNNSKCDSKRIEL